MRFRRKVAALLILIQVGLVGILASLVYPRLYGEQMESLRRRVTGIAATGALTVDGDLHQSIPADPSSASLPAYHQLQTRLKQILAANPGIRYVWTMVRSPVAGQTLLIGDTGVGGPKGPGRPYDASGIPDLWIGFEVPTADRREVQDPWGVSIPGYAPIRNSTGQVIGIFGVDVYDQQLYLLRQKFLLFLIMSLTVAIGVSLGIGAVVARGIAHPLDRLVHGMRRVEMGHLSHEIRLRTGDEFEDAAAAFNRMAEALQASRAQLRASFLKTIQSLISALEAKDPFTRGHSVSVVNYATEMAKILEVILKPSSAR